MSNGNQLKLIIDDVRNIYQYGARGDGVTNDLQVFINAWKGTKSIYMPEGNYYIDGDGSSSPLIEWFAEGNSVEIYGDGTTSKVTCSIDVVNIAAFTGVHLHHMEFDGGFDPAVATAQLTPLITTNQDCKVSYVKIRNTYGSNLFGKFGAIWWVNNDLGNYGDHALYVSFDTGLTEGTNDVIMQGNKITQDNSYANNPAFGAREAIKIRNASRRVIVEANNITGAEQGLIVEGDLSTIPEDVTISYNNMIVEPGLFGGEYAGIVINKVNSSSPYSEIKVIGNNLTGQDDGDGTGIIAQGVVNSQIISNTIKGFDFGINSQAAGADGLKDSEIAFNRFVGGRYGIFNAGEGAKIHNNRFIDFTLIGARDIYGNECCYNTFDSSEASTIGLNVRTESDINQPTRIIRSNRFLNTEDGLQMNGLSNFIPMQIIGNIFDNCTANSINAVGSDNAFDASEYYGNYVLSGAALPSRPQSGRLTAVSSLPTASEYWRGKQALLTTANVDELYVCRQNGVGVYEWVQTS